VKDEVKGILVMLCEMQVSRIITFYITPVGNTNDKRYAQIPINVAIAIEAQVSAVAQSVSATILSQPRR
jgi:hypothetical protein